ncbi:fungal-specific transcription factor domain-containing protein [Pyrenochaeta sp. MPI-SDFR-AT-0127]|nr:fungal-specific transcription factor domain-containing protein [Pyrenochaeta sp. MPI-SDFR-AT-0127]
MSEATVTPNKRRSRYGDPDDTVPGQDMRGTRKRRAFLQTMGQQLREFGNEGTSPQDPSRTTFGTSPATQPRPTSRATLVAASQASIHHVHTPESDAAPGEDDQLPAGAAKSASKWLWCVDEVLPQAVGTATPPFTFAELLDWSQSYFDHWHPAFPYLHAPSMLDYFREIAQTGLHVASSSASQFRYVILRSIMSISAADRRQMNTSTKALPASLVFHSYNDAINSIQLVLTEESSIMSLQGLVSVQLFLITMHRYNAASRLEGLVVRIAFQLGLHRCPEQMHMLSGKEAELRKRLFWTTFCIDRYICIRLGTPLGIRSDDVDVCYPHAERHGEGRVSHNERDDRLDLLEFLARHATIRGSIMETRHQSAIHGNIEDDDRSMEVDAEHSKWWNMVDDCLSEDEQTPSITKPHQVTLIVLRFESVLAQHRSVLATSKKDAAYNAALQRCISASRSVINTLHKALRGFGAFDGSPGQQGYEITPLLWPSFTWAVWMSVFIIFFAATEEQVPRDVTIRLADRSIQILKHLALRGTSWPDACIVAIQNLIARLRGTLTHNSTIVPRNASEPRTSFGPFAAQPSGSRPLHSQTDLRGIGTQLPGQVTPRGAAITTGSLPYYGHHSSFPSSLTGAASNSHGLCMTGTTAPNSTVQDANILANAYFAGSGNFLGIAQQSSDNPLPNDEIMHLFNNENWLGAGGNAGLFGNNFLDDNDFH